MDINPETRERALMYVTGQVDAVLSAWEAGVKKNAPDPDEALELLALYGNVMRLVPCEKRDAALAKLCPVVERDMSALAALLPEAIGESLDLDTFLMIRETPPGDARDQKKASWFDSLDHAELAYAAAHLPLPDAVKGAQKLFWLNVEYFERLRPVVAVLYSVFQEPGIHALDNPILATVDKYAAVVYIGEARTLLRTTPVSYTHLTLPTKRIV